MRQVFLLFQTGGYNNKFTTGCNSLLEEHVNCFSVQNPCSSLSEIRMPATAVELVLLIHVGVVCLGVDLFCSNFYKKWQVL